MVRAYCWHEDQQWPGLYDLWAGHINSVKKQKHATCRWKQQPESMWPWGWTWSNSPGPGNSPRRLPWVLWSTRLSLWLSPFPPFNCYKWISVDLQDLELTPKKKKRCTFHHRRLDAKVRSQEIPGVSGKFGLGVQNEAGWRLTEFYQENTLVIANTLFQQHKWWLYTWTSPDGQYQNQIDYILYSRRWRSSISSVKTRPGADCGSDHELLYAKSRLKLKKVGKTTRPFRYDLN